MTHQLLSGGGGGGGSIDILAADDKRRNSFVVQHFPPACDDDVLTKMWFFFVYFFSQLFVFRPRYPSIGSRMNRVCKQVSIESPASVGSSKEYVFQYDVMVPDVPGKGARVKVSLLLFVLESTCFWFCFLHFGILLNVID